MNRAERRRRSANAINRRRKFWEKHMGLGEDYTDRTKDTPVEEFHWLKTTSCPCSGPVSGNPRKHFNHKTVQEKKAVQRFKEEIEDAA